MKLFINFISFSKSNFIRLWLVGELIYLQILSFSSLTFFLNSINIYTLWYLGGFYLLIIGFYALLEEGDILIGFLWVIDLGVGLVFFIFILHFSNFAHQKALINFNERYFFFIKFLIFFLIIFYFFLGTPAGNIGILAFKKIWSYFLNWYDYYNIINIFKISGLNFLKEIFFFWEALAFFLINFMIVYGLTTAILISFLLKNFFIFSEFAELKNLNILDEISSVFFIRNQNFIKQQSSGANVKVWVKQKFFSHDF